MRTNDSHRMRDDKAIEKRCVATFTGADFVAEREGDELKIYQLGAEAAVIQPQGTGDRAPSGPTLADINRDNRRFARANPNVFTRNLPPAA